MVNISSKMADSKFQREDDEDKATLFIFMASIAFIAHAWQKFW